MSWGRGLSIQGDAHAQPGPEELTLHSFRGGRNGAAIAARVSRAESRTSPGKHGTFSPELKFSAIVRPMKNILLLTFALLCLPTASDAAIFDAPDILQENSGAVGAFGELLLSDPTSEGVEVRGRYGLSDDLNVAAILGTGSKSRQKRFGGEVVYNLIPDWDGQLGLSLLGTAMYLERFNSGGIHLRAGIMAHKKFEGFGLNPAIVYLALPFQFDGRSNRYTTGGQVVLGTLMDLVEGGHFYGAGEGGVKLGNADSYILAGLGVRFGDLKFEKRKRDRPASGKSGDEDREYREEDFQ